VIKGAARKSGQRVAVLVDDYDKPFLDFMGKPGELETVRAIFRNYYVQLKASDERVAFIFITGAAKFSLHNFISGLDSLYDISIDPGYGAVCGFTDDEMKNNFGLHIEAAAERLDMAGDELMDLIRAHYGGFCFDGATRVCNPFSAVEFLQAKTFRNFWFEGETRHYLAEYMKARRLALGWFQDRTISGSFAGNPGDPDRTPPEGFLYQAGCLTLRPGLAPDQFTLACPNLEVMRGMFRLLMGDQSDPAWVPPLL
jgi:hypothetical protein